MLFRKIAPNVFKVQIFIKPFSQVFPKTTAKDFIQVSFSKMTD